MKIREILKEDILKESSLSRIIDHFNNLENWAILTAYRKDYTKTENIIRNRRLRGLLDEKGLGVQQLLGHYKEPDENGKLISVIERSYFVPKPDNMDIVEFKNIIYNLAKRFDQWSSLIKIKNVIWEMVTNNKEMIRIGDRTNYRKNNIEEIYSKHIKKLNVPFNFINNPSKLPK